MSVWIKSKTRSQLGPCLAVASPTQYFHFSSLKSWTLEEIEKKTLFDESMINEVQLKRDIKLTHQIIQQDYTRAVSLRRAQNL